MFIARVLSVRHCLRTRNCCVPVRWKSSQSDDTILLVNDHRYHKDDFTNVTPKILSHLGRNLHLQKQHPLCLIKERIVSFIYSKYRGNRGNPLFTVVDQLDPVVTVEQNFDCLLVPKDHVSRNKSDSFYLNRDFMLRAHTSAHQSQLIKMGLDNFLAIGDVYRRDEIDKTHYPVFHQVEGVRLIDRIEFDKLTGTTEGVELFENGDKTSYKQALHTLDAAKISEVDLKDCLTGLAKHLFGDKIEYRWVDCYFPFTHPSWELEVKYNGEWLEVLGCGIMEQEILSNANVNDKIGWAFGLGLERLAMVLYNINDIRTFWSTDTGFLSQFANAGPNTNVNFKPLSKQPQCYNDISFWLPESEFSPNDFYDLVRNVGGDNVEQVTLIDEFVNKKKGLKSQCYRITYRHMNKPLTQDEVNLIHKHIEQVSTEQLGVTIR